MTRSEKMAEKTVGTFSSPEKDSPKAEQEIRGLAGVLSCRVVTNPDGRILEIHVVASPERHPKQIIRDIETVLFATFGVRIDHKKVSVAQVPASPEPVPPTDRDVESAPRLRFLELHTTLTPEGGEIQAVLGRERNRGFGKASFTIASDPARAVVEATLDAVGKYTREGRFQLGVVQRGRMGEHEAVFVQVDHVRPGRSLPLLGSAIVRRDPNLSALHAALDAVNRFLGTLDPTEGKEIAAGPEPTDS